MYSNSQGASTGTSADEVKTHYTLEGRLTAAIIFPRV